MIYPDLPSALTSCPTRARIGDRPCRAAYLQLDTGVDYLLSKRTDAYVLAVLQRATGRDSLGQAAVANISGFTASSTDKQIGLRIGLRHKF